MADSDLGALMLVFELLGFPIFLVAAMLWCCHCCIKIPGVLVPTVFFWSLIFLHGLCSVLVHIHPIRYMMSLTVLTGLYLSMLIHFLCSEDRKCLKNIIFTDSIDSFISELDGIQPRLVWKISYKRICKKKELTYAHFTLRVEKDFLKMGERSLITVCSKKKTDVDGTVIESYKHRENDGINEKEKGEVELDLPGWRENVLLSTSRSKPWWVGHGQFFIATLFGLIGPYLFLFREKTNKVKLTLWYKVWTSDTGFENSQIHGEGFDILDDINDISIFDETNMSQILDSTDNGLREEEPPPDYKSFIEGFVQPDQPPPDYKSCTEGNVQHDQLRVENEFSQKRIKKIREREAMGGLGEVGAEIPTISLYVERYGKCQP